MTHGQVKAGGLYRAKNGVSVFISHPSWEKDRYFGLRQGAMTCDEWTLDGAAVSASLQWERAHQLVETLFVPSPHQKDPDA